MKRIFRISALVLSLALLGAALVGCSVKNKTYTFDSIEFNAYPDGVEEKSFYEEFFKRDVSFKEDGSYTLGGTSYGAYKKSGSKIYVGNSADIDTKGDPAFTLKGGYLVYEKTFDDGVKVTVKFKEKK